MQHILSVCSVSLWFQYDFKLHLLPLSNDNGFHSVAGQKEKQTCYCWLRCSDKQSFWKSHSMAYYSCVCILISDKRKFTSALCKWCQWPHHTLVMPRSLNLLNGYITSLWANCLSWQTDLPSLQWRRVLPLHGLRKTEPACVGWTCCGHDSVKLCNRPVKIIPGHPIILFTQTTAHTASSVTIIT